MNNKEKVDKFIEYLHKYKQEKFIEEYSDDCIIKDIIYGLGISFDDTRYQVRNTLKDKTVKK